MSQRIDFRVLDSLRGIAAVYVVLNHCRGNMFIGGRAYSQLLPIEKWSFAEHLGFSALQLTSISREFVILFFVLSGFSIAHSLAASPKILSFLGRRFLRIYPTFLLALIWAFCVFIWIDSHSGIFSRDQFSVFDTIETALKNLAFIPTGTLNNQFWSLSQEVLFYLVAPFLLIAFSRSKVYFLISIVLYLFGTVFPVPVSMQGNIVYLFLTEFNLYFAIGAFLFLYYDRLNGIVRFRKKSHVLLFCMLLVGMLIIIGFLLGKGNRVSGLLSSFSSLIVILGFLQHTMHNKVTRFLGEMSYTIYITHYATMYLAIWFFLETGIMEQKASLYWYPWMLGSILCVLVSWPLYLLAEKPTKWYLSALRKKADGTQTE